MRQYLAYLLLALFALASCRIVGLTDGYQRLSLGDKHSVAYSSRGEDLSRASVKMLNGHQLREMLPDQGYSLVYYYIPGCRGDQCYPYELLHERVRSKVQFFAVLRNLDGDDVVARSKRLPLYGIDKYYYGTKYSHKLEVRFFSDLTGRSGEEIKREPNLAYLFKGRQYLYSVDLTKVDSLMASLPLP